MVDSSHNVVARQTYDLLTFLGNIGGLQIILQALGSILVGWYADFNAAIFLLSRL